MNQRAPAKPKPLLRFTVTMRPNKRTAAATTGEFSFAARFAEVNHRGDLLIWSSPRTYESQSGKLVAAFASGSWLRVESEPEEPE
jgi:hypothetical protein